jgi:hypothetical protein
MLLEQQADGPERAAGRLGQRPGAPGGFEIVQRDVGQLVVAILAVLAPTG